MNESSAVFPKAKRIFSLSVIVIAVFTVLHIFVYYCWASQACLAAQNVINNAGYLFDLNREGNVSTWFAVVQLLVAAVLCWVCGLALPERFRTRGWFGLAAIFVYLSLDEATDLHGLWALESTDASPLPLTHVGFTWIYFGGALVVGVGLMYLRWLFHQPRHIAWLIILAGSIFVLGGLGFEALGGILADETFQNPAYVAVSTLEETMELLGIALMNFASLSMLAHCRSQLRFFTEYST